MLVEQLPDHPEPKLCRVDQDSLPFLWDAALNIMKEHPQGLLDVMSSEEVLSNIQNGLYDLWLGIHKRSVEVALLTSYSRHAYSNPLFLIWGGGSGKKYWKTGTKTLEHFASVIGATEIRVFSNRPGTAKWAEKLGYKPAQTVFVKHIPQPKGTWRN